MHSLASLCLILSGSGKRRELGDLANQSASEYDSLFIKILYSPEFQLRDTIIILPLLW